MRLNSRFWRRYCQLEQDILAATAVSVPLGSLLGVFITMLILALDEEVKATLPMGCVLGFVGFIIQRDILGPVAVVPVKYNLAVSMGCTRANFVREYLRNRLLEGVMSLGFLYIVYRLESLIYTRIFSGDRIVHTAIFFRPWMVLLILLGTISAEMLLGALNLRFSVKILFVYAALLLIASHSADRIVGKAARMGERIWTEHSSIVVCGALGVFLLEMLALWIVHKLLGKQAV